MQRNDTGDLESGLLRLVDRIAREMDISIGEVVHHGDFLEKLSSLAKAQTESPIRLYGFRAQEMFAYVAAALGGVAVINEEDQGIFFDNTGLLTRPDFRVKTDLGEEFLIEVKNFRHKTSGTDYSFKLDYLAGLEKYAEVMERPLKIAIYWVGWNCWTLTDPNLLNRSGGKASLSFIDATKSNEMGLLGDFHVGSRFPLSLRLHADITKPRSVGEGGNTPFTIGRVSLHVAGEEIVDEFEKKIASFLMFHGKWNDIKRPVQIDGNLLDFFEFAFHPEIVHEGQGFEIIGSMSQMVTNQYLYSTSDEKSVRSLAPKCDVTKLGVVIPKDYKGSVLGLWRFQQQTSKASTQG